MQKVREMSGNFTVLGEWSLEVKCLAVVIFFHLDKGH